MCASHVLRHNREMDTRLDERQCAMLARMAFRVLVVMASSKAQGFLAQRCHLTSTPRSDALAYNEIWLAPIIVVHMNTDRRRKAPCGGDKRIDSVSLFWRQSGAFLALSLA